MSKKRSRNSRSETGSNSRCESSESDSDYDIDMSNDLINLSNCSNKIKKQYILTRNNVKNLEPNLEEILSAPILQEDKNELYQLYEIYEHMCDQICIERYNLQKQIASKFQEALLKYKQHNSYTKFQHNKFTEELKFLENENIIRDLKYDILSLQTSQENKQVIYSEYKRMKYLEYDDSELPKIRNWMQWAIKLPYDKIKTTNFKTNIEFSNFLQKVNNKLNEELYGMKKAKEQILMFINSRILNPNMKKCSLGLIGPPGTGKTRIATIISELLEFPFEHISLGGIRSPEYLTGHQITYISSGPGEIVKRLCNMGVKNGILFFDEYDKISGNEDVCTALLHITDPTQNNKFRDNFLSGITIDLSYLWFFYSMNKKPEDDALSDRIFYIEIEGYSFEDKIHIVRDYLLKKEHTNMGWKPNSVIFEECAIKYLIEKISPEKSGVRSLEHAVTSIANKINFSYHHGLQTNLQTSFNLEKVTFPYNVNLEKMSKLCL